MTDVGREAPKTFLLRRGNPRDPGEEVQPGLPAVLAAAPLVVPEPPPNASTTGRRLALARWIADRGNPLTARGMVNRIWQYHFGAGLVRTASDIGHMGDRPSHPELLDRSTALTGSPSPAAPPPPSCRGVAEGREWGVAR